MGFSLHCIHELVQFGELSGYIYIYIYRYRYIDVYRDIYVEMCGCQRGSLRLLNTLSMQQFVTRHFVDRTVGETTFYCDTDMTCI